MTYLDIDYIKNTVVDVIESEYVVPNDPIPDYFNEKNGIDQLEGVLERVKMKYYPDLEDKAAYIFVNINKGHFFSNGNKRLALVTTLAFLYENDFNFSKEDKSSIKEKLENLFPFFGNFTDREFNPIEFGYYNLSIIVADSGANINQDELMEGVKEFIEFTSKNE